MAVAVDEVGLAAGVHGQDLGPDRHQQGAELAGSALGEEKKRRSLLQRLHLLPQTGLSKSA